MVFKLYYIIDGVFPDGIKAYNNTRCKEEKINEKNISAQEAPQKKRARLYEENGYKEWP